MRGWRADRVGAPSEERRRRWRVAQRREVGPEVSSAPPSGTVSAPPKPSSSSSSSSSASAAAAATAAATAAAAAASAAAAAAVVVAAVAVAFLRRRVQHAEELGRLLLIPPHHVLGVVLLLVVLLVVEGVRHARLARARAPQVLVEPQGVVARELAARDRVGELAGRHEVGGEDLAVEERRARAVDRQVERRHLQLAQRLEADRVDVGELLPPARLALVDPVGVGVGDGVGGHRDVSAPPPRSSTALVDVVRSRQNRSEEVLRGRRAAEAAWDEIGRSPTPAREFHHPRSYFHSQPYRSIHPGHASRPPRRRGGSRARAPRS